MAGRYICPICDRRLKIKHYCTYCKSFVREPVFYTGPVANEHYDGGGRQDCMAEQHYGLGHVHTPGDGQREYGHHRAAGASGRRENTQNRQSVSVRQNAGHQNVPVRQNAGRQNVPVRQNPGRQNVYSRQSQSRQNESAGRGRGQNQAETILNGRKVSGKGRGKVRGIVAVMLLITVLMAVIRVVGVLTEYASLGLLHYISPDMIVLPILMPFVPIWVTGVIILVIIKQTNAGG